MDILMRAIYRIAMVAQTIVDLEEHDFVKLIF